MAKKPSAVIDAPEPTSFPASPPEEPVIHQTTPSAPVPLAVAPTPSQAPREVARNEVVLQPVSMRQPGHQAVGFAYLEITMFNEVTQEYRKQCVPSNTSQQNWPRREGEIPVKAFEVECTEAEKDRVLKAYGFGTMDPLRALDQAANERAPNPAVVR